MSAGFELKEDLMAGAPRDRDILAFNGMTGWYRTRYFNGLWPLHNWEGMQGTWFPVPTRWVEVSAETLPSVEAA